MKSTLALALLGSALIAVPAMAQTQRPMDQGPRATTERTTEAKAPALYHMKAGQWRASKLDGLDVYNPNNDKIGDISELIVDRGGKVEAVVIGVGGFLGMGEHLVAVPFEKVQWVDQPVEHKVSTNERTTTGSGTSIATAPAPAGTAMNPPATTETAHTSTTVDHKTGEQVTTTTTERPAAGMAQAPATTTDRTVTVDRDRMAANDRTANRDFHPDHAVVAMTKDQLKALPEVRYSR